MSAADRDDDDARLALVVVDGEDSGGAAMADQQPGLVAQLESIQRIMTALDSIGVPASAATPPPCDTWGPYILKEQVGKGGFGIVCRGFDPAVAREIAVKLYASRELPWEPRLMARVHHPNVVTVFGAAVHEERPGIWMEFVRGRTLAERVHAEGPLPSTEVVRIGIELCRALEAVHDAHLVHQDIKPRNVMERDGGGIVLMDFGAGIARSTGDDTPSRLAGTPLYMAPEVVLGGPASVHSDIYSLGVLLYYLLTGTHPIRAATWTDLRSTYAQRRQPTPAQLSRQLHALRPDVSRTLVRCIARALAEPDRRYASAAEFRRAFEGMSDRDVRASKASRRVKQWLPVAAASITTLLGIGIGIWALRSQGSPGISLMRLTGDAGLATDPTRSPDGTLLAYASDRGGGDNLDIWVQRLPGGVPVRLTNDPADDSQPWFTPDGNHVAYRSERDRGGIYVIPTMGGEPRLMFKGGRYPRFSPDGRHVAYIGGKGFGSLHVATVAGGPVRRPLEGVRSAPVWSRDGKHLLFMASMAAGVDWYIARLPGVDADATAEPVRTGALALLSRHGIEVLTDWPIPCDWTGDRVVFHARRGDTTNIWEVGLSSSFSLTGKPKILTLSTEDQYHPSVGPDGSILFSTRTQNAYLWELLLDPDVPQPTSAAPRQLMHIPHHPGRGTHDLSDDGRRLVYSSVLPRDSGIFVRDLDHGVERVITTRNASVMALYPVISPDGTTVLYGGNENSDKTIRRASVHGGIPETICLGCGPPTDWSPDGRFVSIQYGVPERASLGVMDLVSARRVEILKHATQELYRAGFSPDGRWVTFHSALAAGSTQEFVAPFRGLEPIAESEWIPITDGDSWTDAPHWSPNGNLLYYVSDADGFRCIWAQPLEPTTKRPAGEAFVVHHAHNRKHSIGNIHHWAVELSVARGKLVFNMGEARGDIWLAHFQP